MPNDGGAAFPNQFPLETGMSLRDWFAGLAMQGMMACGFHDIFQPYQGAERAYAIADAMIAERSKDAQAQV